VHAVPPVKTIALTFTDVPIESVGEILHAIRACGLDLEVRVRQVRARAVSPESLLRIDSKMVEAVEIDDEPES
jgi:hypothetical protein